MSEQNDELFEDTDIDAVHTDAVTAEYTEADIQTLDWDEHIRQRPGMYIGSLGDGSNPDDGIYILFKEVIDNAIDEYAAGYGRKVEVRIEQGTCTVRDYGRGIPLNSVVDVVSKINTGGKFRKGSAFRQSVGQNGVGVKAVNALSAMFEVQSFRDGHSLRAVFSLAKLVEVTELDTPDEPNGTMVRFTPSTDIFGAYVFHDDFVLSMLKNYTYLNPGLRIVFNGKGMISRHGLLDLLEDNMTESPLYPVIHLKGPGIEIALTHINQYGDEYYSFVNGTHTSQGGTHLTAFKEAVCRTIRDFYGKGFEYSDIRNGMVAAVSIGVDEPIFDSQKKTRLSSTEMGEDRGTIAKYIGDFVRREFDNYLHREPDTADVLLKKVQASERDRKAMSGVAKKVRENAKKVSLYNPKLNDCRVHLSDARGDEEKKQATSIFITEGDSAGGSIEKVRNVETQAVFKLLGKPMNSYVATQAKLSTNEELTLLKAALNIEDGLDGLRYNKVIIATDADVDGMHIRLLMLTFFLKYFPDLIKKGHVYVLQTPLFRVRNKKTAKRTGRAKKSDDSDDTIYCYTDQERLDAIARFGDNAEITRFKGLGEISPEEFRGFIGPNMRLDRVSLRKEDGVAEVLAFYMGKNTMERQNFIIDNLVVEDDTNIDR